MRLKDECVGEEEKEDNSGGRESLYGSERGCPWGGRLIPKGDSRP
jgi:hypothetical protein